MNVLTAGDASHSAPATVLLSDLLADEPAAIRIGPFGSALKKHEYSDAGIRVLGIDDVLSRGSPRKPKFIPETKYAELSQYRVRPGDILVTNMGTVGRAFLVPPNFETAIISSHLIKVTPDLGRVDANYLERAINDSPAVTAQIANDSRGAIMAGFNTSRLKQLRIPLPPLAQQRRIAAILDQADVLRTKRLGAITVLETLTQSVFLDMFGDPVRNPMDWPVRNIGQLLDSATYGTSRKAGRAGALPILRMGNITMNGDLDLTDLKLIDLPEAEHVKHTVRKGDILFNRTNSPELVGKSAVVDFDIPMVYAGYLIRLRCKADASPEYLGAFLNLSSTKVRLRAMGKAIIGMANINAREIQAVTLPVPPFSLQVDFEQRVNHIRGLSFQLRHHADTADNLFASLQHRAFRGEL